VLRSSLIVPFSSPKVNKSNVVAIPSFVPPFNIIFNGCNIGWSVDEGGRFSPSRLVLIGTYFNG